MSPVTLDAPQTSTHAGAKLSRRTVALFMALAFVLSGLTMLSHQGSTAQASYVRYPSYQPQTTCSPSAKRGTVFMAKWLQHRYPGSGSLGISRACSSGGVSEHKEGRAFDWALNANRARDRGYAKKFRTFLFRKGNDGLNAARARRMGVMYVIWNKRIYSASYKYRARPYSGASSHRDHMHISLTRAGGAGRTPWFKFNMR